MRLVYRGHCQVQHIAMLVKIVLILVASAIFANAVPVTETSTKSVKNLSDKESPKLSPTNQNEGVPNLDEMDEIKEEDIADGTWVMEVEEPIDNKLQGESMDTASNIVFRPLFRYRQKQSSRRFDSNRRVRRRYYVPRRSYRETGYYRPYRSAPYYRPYRHFRY